MGGTETSPDREKVVRDTNWRRVGWAALGLICVGWTLGCDGEDPELPGTDAGDDAITSDTAFPDGTDGGDTDRGPGDADIGPDAYGLDGELDYETADDRGLRTLSTSEKADICRTGQAFLADNITSRQSCKWAAHYQTYNTAPMTDEKATSECQDAFQAWQEDSRETDICNDVAGGHNCQATVGQWERCEEALIVRFVAYVAELPACANVTSDYYAREYRPFSPIHDRGIDDPEACQTFRDNCPEFYEKWMGPIKWP